MPSFLLNLPIELLNHILWYLGLDDLQSCQLVHPTMHSEIKDSILLKYLTALKAFGMEDNRLHTSTPTAERFNILRRHENNWSRLQFNFHHTMQVQPNISWPVGLDGGVLFLLDNRQKNLHYITLPSTDSDNHQWSYLPIDRNVLDFCLAIVEHDLIAIATMSHDRSASTEIEILLLQVSTGLPHPLAQNAIIVVANTSWRSCTTSVSVSGDNLVVLVNNFSNASMDQVFVYDWMSGVLKMTITAPHHSYNSILFLSVDRILLPNRTGNSLDIWNIAGSAQTTPRTRPDIILGFLPFREDTILMGLSCWGGPCPVTYGIPHSNRPFRESPSDAIVYFRVHVQTFHTTPLEDPIFLSIFVHRHSLLELCDTPTTKGVNRVPWRAWGPPVIRLLTSDVIAPQWLTASTGERYVALNGGSEIITLDFNPARIKAIQGREDSGENISEGEGLGVWTERGTSCFMHGSLEEPVLSELPYACYKRKNVGPFDALFMDGERLLGLRTHNHGQTITEVEVMHLG